MMKILPAPPARHPLKARAVRVDERRANTELASANAIGVSCLTTLAPIATTLYALGLWHQSLDQIDVRRINDFGLISVLPPAVLLSLILLSGSFCLSLCQRRLQSSIVAFHVIALICVLYGTPVLVAQEPPFGVAWRHVGIIDFITQTGTVNPNIDAYFNWPGFFVLGALITNVAGLDSALPLVPWTPVIFNLALLIPLKMIFHAVTDEKRLVWLAAWIFYLTNWIGQDYFSPQAFAYFIHLVILAILLRWFNSSTTVHSIRPADRKNILWSLWRLPASISAWAGPEDVHPVISRPLQRVGMLAVVIILYAAIVYSHQLTPFITLGSITALVIFNRCTTRGLPIIMATLLVGWLGYGATAYMSGHGASDFSYIGRVQTVIDQNVTSQIVGSFGHLFVLRVRLLLTGAIWILALLGGISRLIEGHRDLTIALLAATPFPLLALQPYGGEMLLRVYFFSLPFMAFFAAASFFPSTAPAHSWRTEAAVAFISLALVCGFLFARYGNERMDEYTPGEVAAVNYLYQVAKPGSLLLAGTSNVPWRFRDYATYRYEWLSEVPQVKATRDSATIVGVAESLMESADGPTYLIVSRGQKAQAAMMGDLPPQALDQLETAFRQSPRFRLIFENGDAQIFAPANQQNGKQG